MHRKSRGSWQLVQEVREEVPDVRGLLPEQAQVRVHRVCPH